METPKEYMSDNEYMKNYMKARWLSRRARYIAQLGGKCVDCGTSDNLQFDHIDPNTKSFTISTQTSRSEEAMQKELKLCVLRCSDCHIIKNKVDGSAFKNKVKGEKINTAKLTEDQALYILTSMEPTKELAAKFGINRHTVADIKSRRTWKHLAS